MSYEPELRDLEADDAPNRAARARVKAAAEALATAWAPTADAIPDLARTMTPDAWVLEDAGLLKGKP